MVTPSRRSVLGALPVMAAGASAAEAASATGHPAPSGSPWTGSGFVQRAGGKIHYVTLGEGPAVVCLHKLGGRVSDWRKVAPLIAAQGRKVIAIDLPGHGQSKMTDPPPYFQSVAETAAMVKAVLTLLEIERFSLVGNSLGGGVSLIIAATWPEAVERLILLSASMGSNFSLAKTREQDAIKVAEKEFTPDFIPLPRSPADLARFGFTPEVAAEDQAGRAQAGVWVRISERGAGMSFAPPFMKRVEAPTLMLLPEKGVYLGYEPAARANIRHLKVVHVPDTGSFIHMEHPQVAAAAVNAFLADPEVIG